MGSAVVPGFLPSRNGFHFANHWPSVPAFLIGFGMVRLGIGDASRGLCGGMSYAVRDRFEAGRVPPPDLSPPPSGTPLFEEIARRQLDSFDRLVVVPWRFWLAAIETGAARERATASVAWPAIRDDIDAGRLAMIGLVRSTGWNPFRITMGHQVAAYRYDETAGAVTIGVYDPNHPDDDTIELRMAGIPGGPLALSQSTGEPLTGLLHLAYVPPSRGRA